MPDYHFPACFFYGVLLNQDDILQMMKYYPQFRGYEFDKDDLYHFYRAVRDLSQEIDQEHLGVTLDSFHHEFEEGNPIHFLAISNTYQYRDLRFVEVGNFEDWNKRLEAVCGKYGIKWGSTPQYYLLKDVAYPPFQVIIGYGVEANYEAMLRLVMAHRALLGEEAKANLGIIDRMPCVELLNELCEEVEELWALKRDPIQIVHILDEEGDYFLMIRDTYQAHELKACPQIQPPQRELWDALLKAKSSEYGIEWLPPRYWLVLNLPMDY